MVRSAREKRYEALHNLMHKIRNSKKIKDFNKMETSFVELIKAYDKARPVIEKEESGVTPRFYVRILVEMEDLINATWEDREGRKKMNKNNSKSLSALRQKLRKYIKEFEDDMAKFRENPDADDDLAEGREDEEQEDFESDDDSNALAPSATTDSIDKKVKKIALDDEDDESDDSYWGSDSDESSSSSGEERDINDMRKKFLKKDDDKKEKKLEKKAEKGRKRVARIRDEDEDEDEEDDDWIKVDRGAIDKPKMFDKDAEITHELVIKKLREIMAARGKKRTNRKEQIELLSELYKIVGEHNLGSAMLVKVQFAIVSAIFDYNPKISAAMKPEYWEKCMPAVEQLLTMIDENKEELTTGEAILEDNESLEAKPYRVRGCFLACVERLNDEFSKVLKSCDAHSNEYVERLKDEPRVMTILDTTQALLEKTSAPASDMCRIFLQRINHIYFKFDPEVIQQKHGEIPATQETSMTLMDKMCKFIYAKDATDRLRTRAILFHIYHHAIHDNWYEARDLMLMSHLQDTITHSDPLTQICYNRTMVQLGLCGFRHAEIRDAHNALLDIQLGGRSKELLAQGLLPQRHHERSSEQEKIEKQRQMPFHMHINLEMLECVYLVSAMLIEIPYMAAHEFDARRRMISKSYYQQLRSSERQALVGPPESMREHVVAASKAMRNGDWKRCRDLIINDKMNGKVWDLFYEADKVRLMLTRKVQEEALRTYLFTYSKVYDSVSMETLSEMFELEKAAVHAIVSKMIINEELMASMDEPSECMVMHRTEPSRLQSLSLQLADKLAQLVENNERLLELRPGGWQGQWRGKDNDRRDGGNKFGDRKFGGDRDRGGGGGGGGKYGDRDHGHGGHKGGKYNDRDRGDRKYGDKKYGDKHDRSDRKPRNWNNIGKRE